MQTQIQCPNCGTPYPVEVHQVIDVGQNPQLKEQLLAGQLNVAVCPSCGAGGPLTTPMIYHDPAHELFMIYVPQEMDMDSLQREAMVGSLTRQIVENTPQEQRKAYMFQPQQILSMQTFMEKVLETEGITREMIDRQRKQADLLTKLVGADADVQDYLIAENKNDIDDTFFAMLGQYISTMQQMNESERLIPFLNLQAKLMTETEAGKKVEARNVALHKFNRAAKEAGGLSPQLLLEHVIANQDDRTTVNTLIQMGSQAMNYDFFSGLTAEIEAQEAANNTDSAETLKSIRDELLDLQNQMQEASQQRLREAKDRLELMVQAPDTETAVKAGLQSVDDVFMYVLSAEISHAEQSNDNARLQSLTEIHDLIMRQVENQSPPEIRLINELMRTQDPIEQAALLDQNQEMISPEFLQVVDLLVDQLTESGQTQLADALRAIKPMVNERLQQA